MERCEGCGFAWDLISATDVPERLRSAAAAYRTAFAEPTATLTIRREPTTWSALQYGGHVRDVLFNLRDRIVLGLAEDNPVPHRLFPDLRVDLGLYERDDASTLAAEITVATNLLIRTIAALSPEQLDRPIFYAWPVEATRTLRWVAAQALHETEHHLADIEALIARAA